MRKIKAENLITVTYETYAVAQRKPEKIQLCLPRLDPSPLRYQCSRRFSPSEKERRDDWKYVCFSLARVLQLSQEKLKTILRQNFGGQIRCIMGDVQLAYTREG